MKNIFCYGSFGSGVGVFNDVSNACNCVLVKLTLPKVSVSPLIVSEDVVMLCCKLRSSCLTESAKVLKLLFKYGKISS